MKDGRPRRGKGGAAGVIALPGGGEASSTPERPSLAALAGSEVGELRGALGSGVAKTGEMTPAASLVARAGGEGIIACGDARECYGDWPAPTCIVVDGP